MQEDVQYEGYFDGLANLPTMTATRFILLALCVALAVSQICTTTPYVPALMVGALGAVWAALPLVGWLPSAPRPYDHEKDGI